MALVKYKLRLLPFDDDDYEHELRTMFFMNLFSDD